jgi:hypothetical protein
MRYILGSIRGDWHNHRFKGIKRMAWRKVVYTPGDEDEGSLPQGGANRWISRLPAWVPGKSRDQRKPSRSHTRLLVHSLPVN